jgi:hypothetical protein
LGCVGEVDILVNVSILRKNPPWYAAGLVFQCARCGGCCAGPQAGYVWVRAADVAAIVEFLGITAPEMREKYVRCVSGRFSLVERGGNNDCAFLVPDGQDRRKCSIYPVRPIQCRTWPFWKSNLRSPESWAAASMRCPGINHGAIVPCDEIETRAGATAE